MWYYSILKHSRLRSIRLIGAPLFGLPSLIFLKWHSDKTLFKCALKMRVYIVCTNTGRDIQPHSIPPAPSPTQVLGTKPRSCIGGRTISISSGRIWQMVMKIKIKGYQNEDKINQMLEI